MTAKQELTASIKSLNIQKRELKEKLVSDYFNGRHYRFEIYKINEQIKTLKQAYQLHLQQQELLK